MRLIQPPQPLPQPLPPRSVFLAGSIERAAPWQEQVARALADLEGLLLNPHRPDWDSTWVERAADPLFRAQVEWELAGLEGAAVVAIYLAPGSRSPVSLLELGLLARSGRLLVCAPEGFWKLGNVEVVCRRYGVPRLERLEELAPAIRARLG